MLTITTTPYENGETLVRILDGDAEIGSLVLQPRTSGGLIVEVWQYADDAAPLQTVEIPASK